MGAMPTTSKPPTRDRLLDAAQEGIDRNGFAATSIERIIAGAGVTKGTFFYHFKTKNDLARALIDRFAAADREVLIGGMSRAENLSDDPLQQLLIFVGLMIEVAQELDETPHPGCLIATYCFEGGLFDEDTKAVIADAITGWRQVVGDKLRAAAAATPPVKDVDLDSLADMISVLFEGAFVVARSTTTRAVFVDQLRHYRTYLQLLFGA
jgi:TetR/AcrR family transcriptional repressor of nem operon